MSISMFYSVFWPSQRSLIVRVCDVCQSSKGNLQFYVSLQPHSIFKFSCELFDAFRLLGTETYPSSSNKYALGISLHRWSMLVTARYNLFETWVASSSLDIFEPPGPWYGGGFILHANVSSDVIPPRFPGLSRAAMKLSSVMYPLLAQSGFRSLLCGW